ncbi:MAG: hypothetical protein ACC630_09215 [Nitrospinota bacterium]
MMKVSSILEESIKHINPDSTPEESLKEILLSEIKRKLLSYELLDSEYKEKYNMEFEDYYNSYIKNKLPSFDEEQDYFNWEMAITGIRKFTEELNKIRTAT